MNSINFYNNFTFRKFNFAKYRFTDHFAYPGSPSHYIGKLIKGSARLNTHRNSINVKEGDIFYIPKNTLYQSRWYGDKNGEIQFLSIGFKVFPKDENINYSLQHLCPDTNAIKLLEEIETNLTVDCYNIGILYQFLGEVMKDMEIDSARGTDKRIKQAIDYMSQNISCTVSDIALHCNISESGIYALFKRALNKTPIEIKQGILIGKAQEMLITTDIPVEEISNSLGFSSSSYFRKILKKHTGMTPTAIRKQTQF